MQDKIKEVMADVFQLAVTDIDENASIQTTESWDSLKHMELIVSLEENFDVGQFSLDEIEKMVTYDAVCEVIISKSAS